MMLNRELKAAFDELMVHIEDAFASTLGYQAVKKYLTGLISPVERKNGWQISEAIEETTPYALQQFLYQGRSSTNTLQNKLQEYVNKKIGDPDGVLVADETGFLIAI